MLSAQGLLDHAAGASICQQETHTVTDPCTGFSALLDATLSTVPLDSYLCQYVSVAGSDVGVECTIIGVQSLALVPPPSCPFEVRGLFVFDSTSTYLRWTTTPCASSYDIVRGTLPGPAASGGLVNLGTVTCLVNDLVLPFGPDPTTYNGPRDGDVPPAGEAFFYVVRDWPPLWGNSLWLFERGRDGSP